MMIKRLSPKIKQMLILIGLLSPFSFLMGQTYLYFQDSPTTPGYEFSWMEVSGGSELERVGSDMRRFPVESEIPSAQGLNCLRLNWTSRPGGNWFAIAAGLNWVEKNLSQTDSLVFWLRTEQAMDSLVLPLIFMEDVDNTKTSLHPFGRWCLTLNADAWQKVTIPMGLFLNQGNGVDFTRIKTIGFAQNLPDGLNHILYVDDMRVFKGDGTSPAASPPQGVTATPYDRHIELTWQPNPEDFVLGYEVQSLLTNDLDWSTLAVVDKHTPYFIHFVDSSSYAATYRIRALNEVNEPSSPSDTVTAATYPMSDDELLDMVQQYTFRYFWDFAHPVSGMARERNTSGNIVTTGGSGFGIMALTVGIERGFITRQQGIQRMLTLLDFLETADRFHGVWPHWLDGNTGQTIPFSTYDNGGDLVETGLLVQGLLVARQYFNSQTPVERAIESRITALWESVEWDWYTRNNSGVLYWHWSQDYEWEMNMEIRGWNEAAIVYMLAIASPTHGIDDSYWNNGWAGGSYYTNGKSFYGYKLDVGWNRGGPLFFAQYSFLGFDPRNLRDNFTNYFNLNRNHSLIHRAYSIDNPKNFAGYGENCWGLTASDDPDGYKVHEPTSDRDNGTITPTAAISSMPYTPELSLAALKHFYRELGSKTWGWMGFYDAFNQHRNWWATSYLAIDQGPIIGMIENSRTGLLWNNFMFNPEIQPMLDAIGFIYDPNGMAPSVMSDVNIVVSPNPVTTNGFTLHFTLPAAANLIFSIHDIAGKEIQTGISYRAKAGINAFDISNFTAPSGFYLLKIKMETGDFITVKFIKLSTH